MMEQFDRRTFLKRMGVTSLALATPYILTACSELESVPAFSGEDEDVADEFATLQKDRDPKEVFSLSVASGDPTPSGVMLWTRIDPAAYKKNKKLAFEVARDPDFRNVVARGRVKGSDIRPENDYTVKLDLDGKLPPNTRLYYRFAYRKTGSQVGRCRTAPARGEETERLKLGVITCQDYTNGYYGALAQLAQDDVDFVVHLGDFIYETSGDPRFQRQPFEDRTFSLPSGGEAALNLEDYRFIYKLYRSDGFLQKLLEQHTLIAIWDDHETANDCYWDYADGCVGVPDHPYGDASREVRNGLAFDARRAWAEYMPARVTLQENADDPRQFLDIRRQLAFGNLVDLFMTDERSYRDPPPCGTGDVGERYFTLGCPEQDDPERSMLGPQQRDRLLSGIENSEATWKVWGNEVFQGPLKVGLGDGTALYLNLDAWDGYEAERERIMRELKEANVKNLVVLTGDLHTYIASYLKVDYDRDPFNIDPRNLVGVEFMTPAVTSANFAELIGVGGGRGSLGESFGTQSLSPQEVEQLEQQGLETLVRITNPHIQFFNSEDWGYATVEFTASYCEYTAYKVDKSKPEGDDKELVKRLRVPVNRVRIEETSAAVGAPLVASA